jgi:hypothetical protein
MPNDFEVPKVRNRCREWKVTFRQHVVVGCGRNKSWEAATTEDERAWVEILEWQGFRTDMGWCDRLVATTRYIWQPGEFTVRLKTF